MSRLWVASGGSVLIGAGLIVTYLVASRIPSSELIGGGFADLRLRSSCCLPRWSVARLARFLGSCWRSGSESCRRRRSCRPVSGTARPGCCFQGVVKRSASWPIRRCSVATIGIASSRRHARVRLAGSELIIYSVAVTAVVWLASPARISTTARCRSTGEAWIWLLPMLDGLLALVALRGVDLPDRIRPMVDSLVLGFVLLGAAHVVTGWQSIRRPISAPVECRRHRDGCTAGDLPGATGRSMVRVDGGERPRDVEVHWAQIFGCCSPR